MDAAEMSKGLIDALERHGMPRLVAAFKVAWWAGFFSGFPYPARLALWKKCTSPIGKAVGLEMLRFHEWERRN